MTIRIDQRGRKYFVYLNESSEPILVGQWYGRWFKRIAEFLEKDNKDKIIIENSFRLDFWNMTYLIKIPGLDLSSKLKPVRIFRGHWRLENGSDTYDYFIQKGHKKSLFKNGTQIAAYDKKYFHLFEKDTMYIKANSNEPVALLISFAIAFDLGSDNDGATMTYDVGNIGPEVKTYDVNWKPK